MKNTRENVTNLLCAMVKSNRRLARSLKEHGEEDLARIEMLTGDGLEVALWLLTDSDYFDKISETYMADSVEV